MLTRLGHVTLAIDDLANAVDCYSRLLGRAPGLQAKVDGTSSVWFALDNVALELRRTVAAPQLLELGFAVTDLEAAEAWARDRDLRPSRREQTVAVLSSRDDRTPSRGPELSRPSLDLDPDRTGGIVLTLSTELDLPLEPTTSDRAGAVRGLDHVVVRTGDADDARALYEKTLGLRVALDREFEQWAVRLIFCRLAGLTVEIAAALPAKGQGLFDSSEPAPTRDALWGLSWRVADADRAQARIASEGFDVSEVRPGRKPGTRVFTVRDGTCGVPTLILEPAAG